MINLKKARRIAEHLKTLYTIKKHFKSDKNLFGTRLITNNGEMDIRDHKIDSYIERTKENLRKALK